MKKALIILSLLAIPALILISCGKNNPVEPIYKLEQGKIAFVMSMPSDVAFGHVIIAQGDAEIVKEVVITNYTGSVTFDNIQVGKWYMLVQLFDSEGNQIYDGQGEANITKDQTTTVTIRVTETGGTGNLEIIVDMLGTARLTPTATVTPHPSGIVEISGGITSNTTWYAANIYKVIGDAVVFPGFELTIEPGTIIMFADDKYLEIRGRLSAKGRANAQIYFASTHPETAGQNTWQGIKVYLGGKVEIRHAHIRSAHSGIFIGSDHSGQLMAEVYNTTFENNKYGGYGHATGVAIYNKCVFRNNDFGLRNEYSVVSESQFENNRIGVDCKTATVSHCIFTGHTSFAVRTDKVSYSTFSNNKVGCDFHYARLTGNLTGNTFQDNDIAVIGYGAHTIVNNNFINNREYSYKNDFAGDINMPSNYWGTTDANSIDAMIFDGHDDIRSGLVHYLPVLIEPYEP